MRNMTRKILASLLVMICVTMLAIPSYATSQRIVDKAGLLSSNEVEYLNDRLRDISEKYEYDVVVLTAETVGEQTLKDYLDEFYKFSNFGEGKYAGTVILLYSKAEKQARLSVKGNIDDLDSASTRFILDRVMEDGINQSNYAAAFNSFANWCEVFFGQALTGTPYGEGNLPEVGTRVKQGALLVDDDNLLKEENAKKIEERLNEVSDKHAADIVIVTVPSIGNKTAEEFADDFFDSNGYGRYSGSDKQREDGGKEGLDGILLLISLEDRDWWISTSGRAIDVFTDAGIEYIGEEIKSAGLSDGYYSDAFNKFIDLADDFFTRVEKGGSPYDAGSLQKSGVDIAIVAIIAFLFAIILAFVVTSIMTSQLKSVKLQTAAEGYIRVGSMKVTNSKDQFLYKNVTKTERVSESSSSSGGSSSHSSSSGSSHGGGGGKF